MFVAGRLGSVVHPERGDPQRPAARMAEDPTRCRCRCRDARARDGRCRAPTRAPGPDPGRTAPSSRPPSCRRIARRRCPTLPATTWALVATRSGATTKPVPSWTESQASLSSRTVEAAIRWAVAWSSPVSAGGGPSEGAGRSASNTCG